jgi:hypothetical protein
MAWFYYGTGSRGVTLATTTENHQTKKYTNILSTMQSLDSSFTYSGRVGALLLSGQNEGHPIWAQAMTTNGNYGKTFPGLSWTDGNTANLNRYMVIPNIQQSSTFRTFVGFFNATSGGYSMSVDFYIMSPNNYAYLGAFSKTFESWEFKAFNPFVEAGITGDVTNAWLFIRPTASGHTGTDSIGLICFGSTVNNYSNDTYALIAVPFE